MYRENMASQLDPIQIVQAWHTRFGTRPTSQQAIPYLPFKLEQEVDNRHYKLEVLKPAGTTWHVSISSHYTDNAADYILVEVIASGDHLWLRAYGGWNLTKPDLDVYVALCMGLSPCFAEIEAVVMECLTQQGLWLRFNDTCRELYRTHQLEAWIVPDSIKPNHDYRTRASHIVLSLYPVLKAIYEQYVSQEDYDTIRDGFLDTVRGLLIEHMLLAYGLTFDHGLRAAREMAIQRIETALSPVINTAIVAGDLYLGRAMLDTIETTIIQFWAELRACS